jgi:hypothetical protein
MLRGGSWFFTAIIARGAIRFINHPDRGDRPDGARGSYGFRAVLAPCQSAEQ